MHLLKQEQLYMTSKRRAWAPKLARSIGLTVLAGAAIYTFSPAVQNQFGSVKPQAQRALADHFSVQILNGGEWSLREQRGKVVLVNFWATWCPPCRVETPALVVLQRKYADRGFTVAGVTMDEEPHSTVPDFMKKYGIVYPILTPTEQLSLIDRVESLPTSILIDKSGRIARTYVGLVTESGLSDDIEAVLSEREGGA
jgi:cytochrome c biogenesis protein CcmG, thiol:disulfide interchange protein DsbE